VLGLVWALAASGCNKEAPVAAPSTPEPELKNGHPVVHLPPVETHPFESGYDAGFEFGKQQAQPHMTLPKDDEARRVAHEQAANEPGRPERWERGFTEGYLDGIRKVVTGQK
jgi:hypothetical protein